MNTVKKVSTAFVAPIRHAAALLLAMSDCASDVATSSVLFERF